MASWYTYFQLNNYMYGLVYVYLSGFPLSIYNKNLIITLANHKEHWLSGETIKTQSKYM